MAIPTPIDTLNELNKLLFKFVWEGKPDKINRVRLCTYQLNGGLKMTNIFNFEKLMKIRWLKQIFSSNVKSWLNLLLRDLNLTCFSTLGSQWCLSVMHKLNPFWKIVFTYFNEFCQFVKPKTNLDISCMSLWLNKPLGTENIHFVDWVNAGIHVVGDIIKQDGQILTLDEMKTIFGFRVNYLNYSTVRGLVKGFLEQNPMKTTFDFDFCKS